MTRRDETGYSSPIYRTLDETLNNTLFEMYVRESYRPVVHQYYIDHPNVAMLNAVSPMEENNLCYTRLPIINVIDLIVNGHEFAFKFGDDVPKVVAFLEAYIKQYESVKTQMGGLKVDKDMQAFIEDAKFALKKLKSKNRDIEDRKPRPKTKLTLVQRLKLFGPGIF